jgi:hypothetical protein
MPWLRPEKCLARTCYNNEQNDLWNIDAMLSGIAKCQKTSGSVSDPLRKLLLLISIYLVRILTHDTDTLSAFMGILLRCPFYS